MNRFPISNLSSWLDTTRDKWENILFCKSVEPTLWISAELKQSKELQQAAGRCHSVSYSTSQLGFTRELPPYLFGNCVLFVFPFGKHLGFWCCAMFHVEEKGNQKFKSGQCSSITSPFQLQPPWFNSVLVSGVWLVSLWSSSSVWVIGWMSAEQVGLDSPPSLPDCKALFSLWVWSSDDSSCPFRGLMGSGGSAGSYEAQSSINVCVGGGSHTLSARDSALEGEDGGVSLPVLQSSVECVWLVSACVSSTSVDIWTPTEGGLSLGVCVWLLSGGVCSVVSGVCEGSGCSGICSPESRVWQRPRGRSLSRGPALRLAEGLLTSTVSPRLNLLLSGFT